MTLQGSNALHILAMREGGEPVAIRTEALAQLSKLELIRVDVDGRPFPLELTPLGLEVWALRQPGSTANRYEVERDRIRKLVEASGGRLVTTAEQPQLPTYYRRLGPPRPAPGARPSKPTAR